MASIRDNGVEWLAKRLKNRCQLFRDDNTPCKIQVSEKLDGKPVRSCPCIKHSAQHVIWK